MRTETFCLYHQVGQVGPRKHLDTDNSTLVEGKLHTNSIISVEREYFRHVRHVRTDSPGQLIVHSPVPDITHPAVYRTDRIWTGHREMVGGRRLKIWASPQEGWILPDRSIVQGLLHSAGWTQVVAAEMIGVDGSNFRKWLRRKHNMPFSAWRALLHFAGFCEPNPRF